MRRFHNIGAFIIRKGFRGPVHYNYNKEPPKVVLVIIKAPILGSSKDICSGPGDGIGGFRGSEFRVQGLGFMVEDPGSALVLDL